MSRHFGNYFVATGQELGLGSRKFYETGDEHIEYHVVDRAGHIHGTYKSMSPAIILAKGLEKSDLKQLDKEIDELLVRDE